MSFVKPSNEKDNIPDADFKMTFALSNNKTTTNSNGSGLFMNIVSGKARDKKGKSDGLFMNVTLHEKKEKIRDPNIIRFESNTPVKDDDSGNPNIIKIVRY